MIEKAILDQLKQKNISVDAEKTKTRVETEWKALPSAVKNDIIALTDVARSTVYRIFTIGSISAKIAIAIAQAADFSPRYLTGAVDEKGVFDDDDAKALLVELGYEKVLNSTGTKPVRRRRSKAVVEPVEVEVEAAAPIAEPACPECGVMAVMSQKLAKLTPESDRFLDEISDEELDVLFRAALVRGRAGGDLSEVVRAVKMLLIL